jgi:hypothetical protein
MPHMPSRNTFPDLDAVKRERGRLMAERDRYGAALHGHWQQARTTAFRRKVIGSAITDILRSVKPLGHLLDAFGPGTNVAGTLLGLALGSRVRGAFGKTVLGGIGAMLPTLFQGFRKSEGGGRVLSELGRSWQRIKERAAERRSARQE